MTKHNDGWIYVIEGAGLYKIGRAIEPEKRLSDMKIGSPVPLEIIHVIRTLRAISAEAHIHRQYEECRHHGEWFQLGDNELKTIMGIEDFEIDTMVENNEKEIDKQMEEWRKEREREDAERTEKWRALWASGGRKRSSKRS